MEGQLRLSGKAGHAWAGFTAQQLWPGEGLVGTTLRLFLNHAGNSRRESAKEIYRHQLCYPYRDFRARVSGAGVWGSWLPFSFPAFPHPESGAGRRSGVSMKGGEVGEELRGWGGEGLSVPSAQDPNCS